MRGVSGVRGIVGSDLTVPIVARYAAGYAAFVRERGGRSVVLGRDSRPSGVEFAAAAAEAMLDQGVDVVEVGLVPTPTVQLAVEHHRAGGGLVITASHNPVEWNALKFVGPDGLFLDVESVERVFALVDAGGPGPVASRGRRRRDETAVERHVAAVLALPVVAVDAIRARRFAVALDCVRGAGGVIMPRLLEALHCRVAGMDLEPDGRFPRAPEPVPEHLGALGRLVVRTGADVGMAVDPDVDRLALVSERGEPIGEDYTLAFAVRAVLARRRGPVVVNLSTSLVVDDAARTFGVRVERVPVGEAHVARGLRDRNAVVGGEGNGGVMLPGFHLGRDAPLAAALALDLLARAGATVSELVAGAPRYVIVKAKAPRGAPLATVYAALERAFPDAAVDRQDGLRLGWADRWLHVRPSGTEPIVRLIAEAPDRAVAEELIAVARRCFDAEG